LKKEIAERWKLYPQTSALVTTEETITSGRYLFYAIYTLLNRNVN